MDTQFTNSLIHETSPYLLQHAHNPVEWYPWGKEALERARRENKPVLLSIGYSACHWCHVMAHESFEDEETARLMNQHFINIKVDREERPDLDKIYQRAHQLLSQRAGGWPLTVFLMPGDQVPFFAGTYFPRQPRFNMPAFKDVLSQIADFHQHRAAELHDQNRSLLRAMQELQPLASGQARLTPAPLDTGRRQLENSMDWQHGGFGQAPKFPHASSLEQLLRHWSGTQGRDQRALEMVTLTLRKMAEGGIHDQLGGGFCRYSVDDQWMIPHFEKMLYDNGPLLSLYTQAWLATGEPLFREVMEKTAQWVMREMQSPEGGYYSAQDADSEGEEGRFYVWTPDEVEALLQPPEYALFARRFGLDREANFEGKWYPHVFSDWETLTKAFGQDEVTLRNTLQQACDKLFAAREQRVRPGRDDKVLTSWNALMIRGMAMAGRALRRPDLIASAERALEFIRSTLWKDGRLLATYKDGRAHLNAYLDDYAFLADAILELLQARWREGDLEFARQLCDAMLDHFEDQEHGGFFFTADDHEQLLQRLKPLGDESLPAGNGVAALVLGRMGHLLADTRYLEASERTLQAAWPSIEQLPYAHNTLLMALEEQLYPPQTVVIRGAEQEMQAWLQACQEGYAPRRIAIAIPADATGLPGILAERKGEAGKVLAYVCSGTRCSAPVASMQALHEAIGR